MVTIIIAAGVVAPIISEQFKLDGKQVSVLAIGTGIIIGLAYAVTINQGDYATYAWAGLVAGLSAIGYYELAFNTKSGGK